MWESIVDRAVEEVYRFLVTDESGWDKLSPTVGTSMLHLLPRSTAFEAIDERLAMGRCGMFCCAGKVTLDSEARSPLLETMVLQENYFCSDFCFEICRVTTNETVRELIYASSNTLDAIGQLFPNLSVDALRTLATESLGKPVSEKKPNRVRDGKQQKEVGSCEVSSDTTSFALCGASSRNGARPIRASLWVLKSILHMTTESTKETLHAHSAEPLQDVAVDEVSRERKRYFVTKLWSMSSELSRLAMFDERQLAIARDYFDVWISPTLSLNEAVQVGDSDAYLLMLLVIVGVVGRRVRSVEVEFDRCHDEIEEVMDSFGETFKDLEHFIELFF